MNDLNIDQYKFIVSSEEDLIRLDIFLLDHTQELSRSQIAKHIKNGDVLVNNVVKTKPGFVLRKNDEIIFNYRYIENESLVATKIDLNIVYEDEDLIVINKPKGLVVHPSIGHHDDTLVNGLLYYLGHNLANIDDPIRPGIVHRIDKDTSGLLVVAKNDATHSYLSHLLKNHEIRREYYAIVHGNISENSVTINAPIGRDSLDRLRRKVGGLDHKQAITEASVISRLNGRYTLLSVKLHTGRTHQIRVHFAHLNYPIVGDVLYGRKDDKFKDNGQFLHAYRLSFIHPKTNKLVTFETEMPLYMQNFIKENS